MPEKRATITLLPCWRLLSLPVCKWRNLSKHSHLVSSQTMWISSHNNTGGSFMKQIRVKACTKVPIVWPRWEATSSTSSSKRCLCTAYTAGFLHYQLFVSIDRSSRSQPHDATRQFVQIGYLSPDNLDSSPQVSPCFGSAVERVS